MPDDSYPVRSSLSITTNNDQDERDASTDTAETVPLRTRILQMVQEAPDHTIRPARLSQALGLSVTDASAELCGLLQAVGPGSTFRFETIGAVQTMVFSFPPDFQRKALAKQRQEDWKQRLGQALEVAWKALKMITAFGLILSTVIVSIAGMVALVAAMVAMSRGGDQRTRHHLSRQLHNLFIMVRQLLWCYAMMGPSDDGDGQDPFLREAAYDTSLMLSVCCGNPASLWFWMRASHLRQRRRRIARGWGRMTRQQQDEEDVGLEGVRLIRRGEWGDETLPVPSSRDQEEHRGLLSVAVEFLFGATSAHGLTEADKWRLRSAVLVERSQESPSSSVSLEGLSPYVDSPPLSLSDTAKVISEGLVIVSHFNGVPSASSSPPKPDDNLAKATFVFPELLAESTLATRYEDRSSILLAVDESRWKGLFYQSEAAPTTGRAAGRSTTTLPPCLQEQRMVVTELTSQQFYRCLLIAILNFVGVVWFAQSLDPGGILDQSLAPGVVKSLQWALIPVLVFYAKLFFLILGLRLTYILVWNEACRTRNRRRSQLAAQLAGSSTSGAGSGETSGETMTAC